MSDWSRMRKRLKDNNIQYKKGKKCGKYNFIVEFGPVKMWFSEKNEVLTGVSIFDLFTNNGGNLIKHWSSYFK